MYVSDKKIEEALQIFKKFNGVMRTREALREGIYKRTLYYMRDNGYLKLLQRGVYQLADKDDLSNPDLIIVTQKIPAAVICLISALDFHNLTDQIPHHIHIALPRTRRDPVLEYPPLKVYRFSDKTINEGVETHLIDGIKVRIFNPAKTIADCFKFRNKIGLDVAIDALKRGVRQQKVTFRDLNKYARICKVDKVIKPYLELLGHE